MTAEQWEQSEEWNGMVRAGHPTDWYSFCDAYAAAQLAEKERRYAFCEVHSGQENPVCPCCEAVYQADLRVEKEREIAKLDKIIREG